MKSRMEHFERRMVLRQPPRIEVFPPDILARFRAEMEADLIKEIVRATCRRMGLSPELLGLPAPEEKQ